MKGNLEVWGAPITLLIRSVDGKQSQVPLLHQIDELLLRRTLSLLGRDA